MDKISFRDFYMIIIPGIWLTIGLNEIFPLFKEKLAFDTNQFLSLLFIILVGFILGHVLDWLGTLLEQIIDQIKNKPHPLIALFDNGFKSISNIDLKKIVNDVFKIDLNKVEDSQKGKIYDDTFTLIKQYVYMQSFSQIHQSLTAKATMFRNLMAVNVIFIVIVINNFIFSKYFDIRSIIYNISTVHKAIIILILTILTLLLRYLSQSIYKEWFKEVLAYFYITFKTDLSQKTQPYDH